jgi:acid phosphatase type 7
MRHFVLICALSLAVSCIAQTSQKNLHTANPRETDQVVVLVGAGDIASCDDLHGAEATAKLIDNIPGTVFAAGDLAYPDGSDEQFAKCYGPTWGRFKDRTRPAPGNHEYHSDGASGYVRYFGAAAGDPKKGYYSYELGAWHIVVLNSECADVGGCRAGSPQEKWLHDDLSAHPAKCTLAYWHKPLFSSGQHGDDWEVKPLWDDLYAANAEIVINGHDHDYERFAPQDPSGKPDAQRGIREFVVGTGGKNSHRDLAITRPNSEIRQGDTFGVLKLTLHSTSYQWQFVPEAGKTFSDSGSGVCH